VEVWGRTYCHILREAQFTLATIVQTYLHPFDVIHLLTNYISKINFSIIILPSKFLLSYFLTKEVHVRTFPNHP